MKRSALSLVLVGLAALPAAAQVRTRWRLEFEHAKPSMHTYRSSLGEYENYWYFTYTITNRTADIIIPIHLDIALYGEAGKDNLHDVGKVDMAALKAVLADRLTAEQYRFGQYAGQTLVPEEVEVSIVSKDAKLGRRSPGIIWDSVKKLKEGNLYLNKKEIREKLIINPGQTYQGIAIFRDVDPRHKVLTVQVSGLVDFVKIARFDPDKGPIFEYENLMRWTRYQFPGDVFDRENDVLTFDDQGWEARRIGPASSKEGLGLMIDAVVEQLRRETALAEAGKPAPEKPAITSRDLAVFVDLLNYSVEQDFAVDRDAPLVQNEAEIWKIHEWWLTNKGKLVFDRTRHRFVESDEELPGTTGIDEPYD